MNEQLIIRNFGPIQEANIELKDLTIFVGPQATGKSLAAQVLYFLREVEELVGSDKDLSWLKPEELTSLSLAGWLGNPIGDYIDANAMLSWEGNANSCAKIQWHDQIPILNDSLKHKIQLLESDRKLTSTTQVYVPAGRTLYSFIPPYSRSYLRLAQEWPGYILSFYENLGKAVRQLWQDQDLPFANPSAFVHERISSILKGYIRYGPNTILLETGKTRLAATTIAAGQMELWPFWAIVEAGVNHGTLFSQQLFFEEPEAHLHPDAQQTLMEVISYLVRQGTKFLITTHSPYILYAVNNFLMAQQVLDANGILPNGTSEETALRPEQVAAYRFTNEGLVENIMDAEVGLIDEMELNKAANQQIEAFTELQESLEVVS